MFSARLRSEMSITYGYMAEEIIGEVTDLPVGADDVARGRGGRESAWRAAWTRRARASSAVGDPACDGPWLRT
jgi:hypothetical protein